MMVSLPCSFPGPHFFVCSAANAKRYRVPTHLHGDMLEGSTVNL
jgi:hypothetical protein